MTIIVQPSDYGKTQRTATVPIRVKLRVRYEEREDVKKLGARWDRKAKTWFVMIGPTRSINLFIRWIDSTILV